MAGSSQSANKTWLLIALGVLLVGGFAFLKWRESRRAGNLIQQVEVIGRGTAGQQWTIPMDWGTMALVQHDDEAAVAQACIDYWKKTFNRPLTLSMTTNLLQPDPDARYFVNPPFAGSVEVDGPVIWRKEQVASFLGMAQYASKELDAYAVGVLVGPRAQTGVMGVYHQGNAVFRSVRERAGTNETDAITVTVDGQAWAEQSGFKPSSGSFETFTMADANALTHHLGIQMINAPLPRTAIVLKEGVRTP